ncbi:MAG: thiamine pyrophosphate-binding protein, partial [Planctomycetes bacterium]|nr:thiamine pyrophosphate-binding protein [Planctomycetota bacterium]
MPGKTRGADLLVRALKIAGKETLFTLSGNQIMPIFDACLDEGIDLIHTRHEAAAVHMADAYGRLTGETGIAMVTAGPGFANTLSALYVALMAESPMVLLSGCSPQSLSGLGPFQEMAQAEMAGHVSKASWTVTDSASLGHDMARAIRTANSGRPGPVHLALPFDLLEAEVDDFTNAIPQPDDFHPLMSLLDAETAEKIFSALSEAHRPLILAGPSMTHRPSSGLLSQLQEATGVPTIGMESPRGINDPSLGAFAEVLARADVIVLIGKQLNFTLRLGKTPVIAAECRFIQIDPETRILEHSKRVLGEENAARLILTDLADPIPAVERLIQLAPESELDSSANRDWLNEVQAAVAYRPSEWATLESDSEGPLHPVAVCKRVQEFLDGDDDAVLISDGGEFGQWAQACLNAPHRVINGPSGSIGSSIPFALAARVAFPDSRIVTLLGDGTFGFHPAELDTAVRYKLPFIALVGNDAAWN